MSRLWANRYRWERRKRFFQQVARKTERDPKECDFYLLWDSSISGEISSDDEDEVAGTDQAENLGKDDFVICPQCGRIDAKANLHFGPICSCENVKYVSLKRVSRTKEKNIAKCPACGYGTFRSFYLGADAATAVLCTDLFEQLPDREIVTVADVAQPEARPLSGPFAKIAFRPKEPETKKKEKQFLCFSDSRSEAAFLLIILRNPMKSSCVDAEFGTWQRNAGTRRILPICSGVC